MEQRTTPPTRQEITESCPGLEASPIQVRDWIELYLSYRGLEPEHAKVFFWRGVELHRASYPTLVAAFKKLCGILDWEAEVLAYDVYTIIEGSIPPPDRTTFQVYVETLFGYEAYTNLMQWTKPNLRFSDQVNCAYNWLGLLFVHLVMLFIFAAIYGFLMST